MIAAISGAAVMAAFAFQPGSSAQPPPVMDPAGPARPDPMPPAPVETAPAPLEFRDADGNLLPPDVQRDLQAQFKDGLPPIKEPEPEAARPARRSTDAAPPARDGEIVVSRRRPSGSVIGDIPPERTFSVFEIGAYGVGNVRELIEALGPQANGGGGDGSPVTLLNGRRVSSFTEIAQIPTEAIERMEVFPEELALRYGYRANQKVVNIITFEKFSSRLGELASNLATEGGYGTARLNAHYFAIAGNTRYEFGAEYNRASTLLETDRGLLQPGGSTGAGGFRTLLPQTERLTLDGLVSGSLSSGVSSTLSGGFETGRRRDRLGQAGNRTLERDTETLLARLGTTSHGQVGKWLWTFTGNFNRLRTETVTDSAGARDRARSVNTLVAGNLLLSGKLLSLPAGSVSATLGGSVELRDFNGASLRGGVAVRTDLSRNVGAVRGALNLPISSRRSKTADRLGDLSANVSAELERLSDFATLRTLALGINWSPVKAIDLNASVTAEQGAPTLGQLGEPLLAVPNVRTFDPARREVVESTWLFGGNPGLGSDDRRVFRLALNARPLAAEDLTLSFEFLSARVDDPIAPFPTVSPRIEAAFPERFARGADGRLAQVDARPLNFARSRRDHLRWGFSFVRPLGKVDASMRTAPVRTYANEAEARAAAPAGAFVTMVQPGSAMARRLENMASRLYISAFHTWQLRDEIVVSEGQPPLDLLDGEAIDLLGGARRHRLEVQAGIAKRGLGGRVSLNWRSGNRLRDLSGGGDLTFSGLATVDVHLFANLADRYGGSKAPGWLKGVRATFSITNLLGSGTRVRDPAGSTPLSYQPAYLDPIGRYVSFGLRKAF